MSDAELKVHIGEMIACAPMPAVAVSVVTSERILAAGVAGVADLTTGEPASMDHWWDLASLTKVLVTLPEVLDLVTAGALILDVPIAATWLTSRGRPVGAATPRQLLSHSAGLPAETDLWRLLPAARSTLIERLLQTRPAWTTGRALYSDVGYLVLGELVSDLANAPLDVLARRRGPIRFAALAGPAVATENCPWRGRIIKGEPHDENAWALGGVAGHAGGFATLPGLCEVIRQTLSGWKADIPVYHEQARSPDGLQRFGLGWWLPPTRGLGGASPGVRSFGISGFVGNRIWFEPDDDYAVVVLSNRIHPSRADRVPFEAWCQKLLDGVRNLCCNEVSHLRVAPTAP